MQIGARTAAWEKSGDPENPYIEQGCICWYDKIAMPNGNPVDIFATHLAKITQSRQDSSLTIQMSVDGTSNNSAFDILSTEGIGGRTGRVDLSADRFLVYCGNSAGTYLNYSRAIHSFVVLTIENDTWRAFVSGAEGNLNTVSRNAVIPWQGMITGIVFRVAEPNQIVVYSRPLTEAEIAANYAIDKARFNLT